MITLVIGGTRSGKSEIAEQITGELGSTVTVITPGSATDPQMSARIAEHRARRPTTWSTVECGPDLIDALVTADGVTLVDSLGSWVAATEDFAVDAEALVRALTERREPTVVVTEEVGLSVHAPSDAGRAFADAVGTLNSKVATVADDALLVVAGRTVRLEP